jgi:hypothetical protein
MSSNAVFSLADYFSSIWRPRVRDLLVFSALAILGFLLWQINPSTLLTNTLGIDLGAALAKNPLYGLLLGLIGPALRCMVALAAGFLFPRGFYLWGLAIAIHTPLSILLLNRLAAQDGITLITGGLEGLLSYAVIEAISTTVAIFFYTGFAGVGVLSRYPFTRRKSAGHSR